MELIEHETIIKASPSITGRQLNGYLATKGKMFAGVSGYMIILIKYQNPGSNDL